MDVFIQKMRFRENRRKALILEKEAWKAITSKLMGGLITYLYKTARKHFAGSNNSNTGIGRYYRKYCCKRQYNK